MKLALTALVASTIAFTAANAASISIGGQLGNFNAGVNCGTGSHTSLIGSSSVREFTFDGVNGSVNGGPCPGTGPDSYYQNYGAISGNFSLGSFGNINFTNPNNLGGDIVTGRLGGVTGAPWADNTPYLVVPGVNGGSSNTLTLGLTGLSTAANYFGLYWGSVDTYNNIRFNLSNNTSVFLTGSNVAAALAALPNGGQFSTNSNLFIDFFVNGATINSIVFSSNSRAFEVDNFAFGAVPAPGALALLGFGLIALGAARRRKSC